MKKTLRSLLFVKRRFYSYPYTRTNLENDLNKIADADYFNFQNDLRCKVVNNNQFDIWEKWNFGVGTRSFFEMGNANAYFSGTVIKRTDDIIIEGLSFPNPFGVIVTYLTIPPLLITLFFIDYSDTSFDGWKLPAVLLMIAFVFIATSLFFRKRIENKVINKLNLGPLT